MQKSKGTKNESRPNVVVTKLLLRDNGTGHCRDGLWNTTGPSAVCAVAVFSLSSVTVEWLLFVGDEISVADPEDVLDRFMAKQQYKR